MFRQHAHLFLLHKNAWSYGPLWVVLWVREIKPRASVRTNAFNCWASFPSTLLPFLFTVLVTTVQQDEAKERCFFEDIQAPEFWQEVIRKTGYDLGYRRYCQELLKEILLYPHCWSMPLKDKEEFCYCEKLICPTGMTLWGQRNVSLTVVFVLCLAPIVTECILCRSRLFWISTFALYRHWRHRARRSYGLISASLLPICSKGDLVMWLSYTVPWSIFLWHYPFFFLDIWPMYTPC